MPEIVSMDFERDPRLVGRARPRRHEEPARLEREDLLRRDRVVLHDVARGSELAEVLDEVERERVVIVDDDDASHATQERT